jgi:hypothetical protein
VLVFFNNNSTKLKPIFRKKTKTNSFNFRKNFTTSSVLFSYKKGGSVNNSALFYSEIYPNSQLQVIASPYFYLISFLLTKSLKLSELATPETCAVS